MGTKICHRTKGDRQNDLLTRSVMCLLVMTMRKIPQVGLYQ
jgi:hypothetical protein